MRCWLFGVLAGLWFAFGSLPAAADGIRWETSLAAAQTRAQREGKPVLLLQLFGRLDEEFC